MLKLCELAGSFLHSLKPDSMAGTLRTIPPLPPAAQQDGAGSGSLKKPPEAAPAAEAPDAAPHAAKKQRMTDSAGTAGTAPEGGVSSAGTAAFPLQATGSETEDMSAEHAAISEGPGAAPRETLDAATPGGTAGLQGPEGGGEGSEGPAMPKVSLQHLLCQPWNKLPSDHS